jgi:hypothetical protein
VTLVAGLDVGNATTELLVADVGPDIAVRWYGRCATAGAKGSLESLAGASRLLAQAERALGARCARLLVAELRPVTTFAAQLPRRVSAPAPAVRLSAATAPTPAGRGVAAGRHVPLARLTDRPAADRVIASVPDDVDFEVAARALTEAAGRGWRLAGVLVAGDDAVLIANRIPLEVPIVDEVDLGGLAEGQRVALEVAGEDRAVVALSDPVALAAALDLGSGAAPHLVDLARELSDARSVALAARGASDGHRAQPATVALEVDGAWRELEVGAAVAVLRSAGPGDVRRVAIPGMPDELLDDVFVADLAAIDDGAWLRRGVADLSALPVAALSAAAPVDAAAELAAIVERPVRAVGTEAEAAVRGVLSTPAVPAGAAVCDLGGGTIDCGWAGATATVAGAGGLVTESVSAALGLARGLAERVKRRAAMRVESPMLAPLEDGSRVFLDPAAPGPCVGRLCVRSRGEVLPFADGLAAEEWRSLRLAIKRETLGVNVERCLAALPRRPETLMLAGGAACDDEATRIVADRLRGAGMTVARANVAARFGPRYAVAHGLLAADEDVA